jgi:large subunit ribosomal protein L25
LPTGFEVNIEGLAIGTQVTAADVILPAGSALITDAEILLLSISEAPTAEDLEAEMAEAVEELGIVEDQTDAAIEAAAEGDSASGDRPAEGSSE